MEPNEPILLPPFSEEEGLKRDISQDLFALYENRILPPVKSDEEIIERIGEAFTIKKVDDPTADEEWAIRLSEEKRVRYATPRFQIYKIVRDEKSALLYDNSLIKNGSYYSIIYDTQEKRFIDEENDFIFLFKYYRGIEIGRNKFFFRNYLNNLRKVNEDKASRQCAQMWWRLNDMKKLTVECPEEGKSIVAPSEIAERLKTRVTKETEPCFQDYSGRISEKYVFRFTDGKEFIVFTGDESGLYYGPYIGFRPCKGALRWPTYFARLAKALSAFEE